MSTVVLYCKWHSDSASVILYFTLPVSYYNCINHETVSKQCSFIFIFSLTDHILWVKFSSNLIPS